MYDIHFSVWILVFIIEKHFWSYPNFKLHQTNITIIDIITITIIIPMIISITINNNDNDNINNDNDNNSDNDNNDNCIPIIMITI